MLPYMWVPGQPRRDLAPMIPVFTISTAVAMGTWPKASDAEAAHTAWMIDNIGTDGTNDDIN
jgi:hypothetical protein